MRASIFREALEKYYVRTYRDQRPVRFASIGFVALLTAYLHVWSPGWAIAWAGAYVLSEVVMILWWRRVQPRLGEVGHSGIVRLQTQMILICAVACAICAAPCFLTPRMDVPARIVGLMLSAGVVLVGAAAHSLRRDMFLITMSPAAAALLWNLYALGSGITAWILALVGVTYVVNARLQQTTNAKVFLDLVKLQVEADAANAAKTEFLATMSHEIRTPLNGVLGVAQILRRSQLDPQQREQVDMIAEAGQSLLSVLNGVLDLSKIESGRLELEIHPFDLAETLKAAIAPFQSLAAQKELAFRVSISPELAGTWRGDSAKLRQVISNLLSNALKFTSEGQIELVAQPQATGVSFQVRDTGVGVAEDKLSMIFEQFTQADATTSRRYGGTGLGLAICRRYVELMGGELILRSRLGAGSTFAFTLPMEREAEDLRRGVDAGAPSGADRPGGVKILAAEDNAINRLILTALLTPLGGELLVVADGCAAVEAFTTGEYDLVLMDVQMPNMDGVEATRRIRDFEAATGRPRTPVIALTANVMQHQTDEYLAAGMDRFVAKPIEFGALAAAIEAVV